MRGTANRIAQAAMKPALNTLRGRFKSLKTHIVGIIPKSTVKLPWTTIVLGICTEAGGDCSFL
jgi:hypothetical protein